MLFKPILAFSLAVLAKSTMAQSPSVSWSTQNGLAIIQNPSGNNDTRIYYQTNSGNITEIGVTGPFDVGHIFSTPPVQVAPAVEVLPGTPIAAAVLGTKVWNEESITIISALYIPGV
ncbi:hypothetical protein C0995_011064 [Termitomyces sp. Mi166|nr:hypothetical protein C0995_011064 [Termitomyces sp. Mi166\